MKTANCLNGVAIEISGGCHAYLAKDDREYGQIFQPGFTGMWGLAEHSRGVDTNIFQNFNKARLFCRTGPVKDAGKFAFLDFLKWLTIAFLFFLIF